ncbi:MAG: uracil-DNA glycosylase [Bacteroidales bacterium]|nr:uracil-DNA glycosylase [Bacteroidales bacterium]
MDPKIDPQWKSVLINEFQHEYFAQLKAFLLNEKRRYTVYPPGNQIFEAFNSTPFEQVKVVILGQDPYHGPGQAHGLCFSVQHGVPIPPSLRNIYKELQADLGISPPPHGHLARWAEQGALLLNATLTVRAGCAGSHQNQGWERFTDAAIAALSAHRQHLVFMLWGSYAQSKTALIDARRHLVLSSPHPSPLSASRGFFGCKHFSQANAYLQQHGIAPIDWQP